MVPGMKVTHVHKYRCQHTPREAQHPAHGTPARPLWPGLVSFPGQTWLFGITGALWWVKGWFVREPCVSGRLSSRQKGRFQQLY